MEHFSIIAGMIASMIFAGSHIPMLLKAYQTQDLHSYSWLNILLINVGNLIYWFYLVSLPLGPVWILHTFYTFSSGLLLILYWRLYKSKLTSQLREYFKPFLTYRISLSEVIQKIFCRLQLFMYHR